MTRRAAYALVALPAVAPRLGVLLYERGEILSRFTEKSDRFAETFAATGTYGFVPGEPSAWTQPVYGFFLVPLYWLLERHWLVVGIAQIALALATALLVYEIGRRFVGRSAGVAAALLATLNPYLVWHDVHVNREIVDQLLAAALVLLTLLAAERRSLGLAAAAGAVTGVAVLGNTRLVLVPLVLGAYLLWRRAGLAAPGVLLAASILAVTPWIVRNRVQLGCATLTTDAAALYKANNSQTRAILARGGWIDDVELPRGHDFTPEFAADLYRQTGEVRPVDECGLQRFYQRRVLDFWRDEPGEKARLAAQAVRLEWDPRPTRTATRAGGELRSWIQAPYTILLFALGLGGLWLVPRRLGVLVVALLAYTTGAAVVFVGATRYRTPWDFLIALLAGAAVAWLGSRVREDRARPSDPWNRGIGTAPADAAAGAGGAGRRPGDGGPG